jgi:sugar-phosphatase
VPGRVAAIVFDLDGVLADSAGVVERAWRRWAREQGLAADDLVAVAHGRPAREVVHAFAPHLDADEEARRLDDWETEDPEGVAAIPGARECVEMARLRPWAIVTSGGRELATSRLRAAGLPIPRVLVTADDVARGKPDPEPYARAAEELGLAPASCLVVEDAPAGITAAKSAGMTVLAVTTTYPEAVLGDADLVFGSMVDVAEYVRTA